MLNKTFRRFGGETGGERAIFIYGDNRLSPSPPDFWHIVADGRNSESR